MSSHNPENSPVLSYKIAVLVFLESQAGEHLLMLRAKPPNLGVWSPIGGKLEMGIGESPFECAVRETQEEVGFTISAGDLHLFAVIAEKAYEGQSHWLLFLFRCKRPLAALPPDISEGKFAFYSREAIKSLPIPETDRTALWPIYDRYRDGFVMLKADCMPGQPVNVEIEEICAAGPRSGGTPLPRRRPQPESGTKMIVGLMGALVLAMAGLYLAGVLLSHPERGMTLAKRGGLILLFILWLVFAMIWWAKPKRPEPEEEAPEDDGHTT